MSDSSVHAPTLFICLLFFSVSFTAIRPQQVNPFSLTDEDFDSEDTDDSVSFPTDEEPTVGGGAAPAPAGGVSELKCREYSRIFTQTVQVIPLVTNPRPVSVSVASCDNSVPLIVGGEEARPGEFPHMAALGYVEVGSGNVEWNCGGTLISEEFVVTAAHCARPAQSRLARRITLARVRLGAVRLSQGPADEVGVAEVIVHPAYRPPAKYNDVALVRLSRAVRLSRLVAPACLGTFNSATPPRAVATGWGHTEHGGRSSDQLMKVALTLVPNTVCARDYEKVPERHLPRGIPSSLMCAGERAGGKDACQGDSGGPLQVARPDKSCLYDVIGITAFGKGCANPNSPGVYTRVSQFVPWIENIVWPRT